MQQVATTTIVGEDDKQQSNQNPKKRGWGLFEENFVTYESGGREQGSGSGDNHPNSDIIIYVLGGPGSGKGTQCSKIVEHFGFTHLSAGELLESEVKSGSETGKMIQEYKKEGKLVPSEIVVKLLQQAMQRSGNKKFLLDGFPRNEENCVAAEKILKIQPIVVLVFECSEEEMIRRVLHRNQGRVDDNIDTVKKRLKVYKESTLPVVDYFANMGKVRKIDAERSIEEVFESVKAILSELGIKNHEGERTVNAQAV